MREIYQTNYTSEVKKIIDDNKQILTKGMASEELKAFDFGVETFIDLFHQVYKDNNEPSNIYVYKHGVREAEEITIEELLDDLYSPPTV